MNVSLVRSDLQVPDRRGRDQERSVPCRESVDRPPRVELTYADVRIPKSAERRPARDDFPPRRMRATVPAHSKPECKGAVLLEFDSLINQTPTSETMSLTAGTRSTTPLCREEPESRSAPHAFLASVNRMPRGARHRAG